MELLPKITGKDVDMHFAVSSAPPRFPLIDDDDQTNKKKRSKKPLPSPEIDLSKVIFSDHALCRLAQWTLALDPEFQTSLGLIETADKIFARSTEKNAIDPAIKVKRCITHKFQEARYFVNHGWRFVVIEEENQYKVVTIERVLGHDPAKPIKTLADIMTEDE